MNKALIELFSDEKMIAKIKRKLPLLFRLAEIESIRAAKLV